MKPESVVSSGYDPVKSEETDDEDMCKDNTSSSHENINIKQEAVKVEVKTEDDVSTDDERSPEYVLSSSSGCVPVKSEETDNEELGDDTNNTSNNEHRYQHSIKVKAEVKIEDDVRTDDECSSGIKEPVKLPTQPNVSSNQKDFTKKRRHCSKRKREEVEESNGSAKKTARVECSVEGCTRKAADSGTCRKKHKGYNYCNHEGCIKEARKGGVCNRHKEFAIVKKDDRVCSVEGCTRKAAGNGRCKKDHGGYNVCSQDGCTKAAQKEGVCIMHGAVVKRRNCSYKGCTNQVRKGGVCTKHGTSTRNEKVAHMICSVEGCTRKAADSGTCKAKHNGYKLCKEEGCTKAAQRGGVCMKHGEKGRLYKRH